MHERSKTPPCQSECDGLSFASPRDGNSSELHFLMVLLVANCQALAAQERHVAPLIFTSLRAAHDTLRFLSEVHETCALQAAQRRRPRCWPDLGHSETIAIWTMPIERRVKEDTRRDRTAAAKQSNELCSVTTTVLRNGCARRHASSATPHRHVKVALLRPSEGRRTNDDILTPPTHRTLSNRVSRIARHTGSAPRGDGRGWPRPQGKRGLPLAGGRSPHWRTPPLPSPPFLVPPSCRRNHNRRSRGR